MPDSKSSTQSPLSADAIRRLLTTNTIGRELVCREEVDSTNILAATLAGEGAPDGTVVVAEKQTHGRGRLGRSWISPPGMNLYVSILLRRPLLSSRATWLPLVGALAVRRSVRSRTGLLTTLKWPNDVMIDHSGLFRKLAGVLAESADQAVVVGIGLNVNMPREAFPQDLQAIATSLLLEIGQPVDRIQLLASLLEQAEQVYEDLLQRPNQIMAEYREACGTVGKCVRIELVGAGPLEGRAEAIAADGALCLRIADGRLLEIRTGDVLHLH